MHHQTNEPINAPPSNKPINAPPSNKPINAPLDAHIPFSSMESSMEAGGASNFLDKQDFFDQHNNLCEVCNQPGVVLCCATCNLVCHMHCARPKLQEEPPNDWKCAYCWVGGMKDGKEQHKAAQACREMERMRRDINNKIAEDDATLPVEDEATLPVEDEHDSKFADDATDESNEEGGSSEGGVPSAAPSVMIAEKAYEEDDETSKSKDDKDNKAYDEYDEGGEEEITYKNDKDDEDDEDD